MMISNCQLHIFKSSRILELWDTEICIGAYQIGLGFTPVGAKQEFGDGKTPEGSYYVCTRNDKSKFYLSLGISYPNMEDANKAFEQGRISQEQKEDITKAICNGVRPPWDTPLGGEIMIHGNGSSSDWTAGCVAVSNDIMDILWQYCYLGTNIIIYE